MRMFGRGSSHAKVELWRDFEAEALPCLADLYRLAIWLTRSRDEAEDLVQETLTEALKSFDRYRRGTNCRAWITTIMYHLNQKRLSRIGRMRIVDVPEEQMAETVPFEPAVPQDLTDEEIISTIGNLPEIFRQVVVLSDVEEFSYKEIASILGIPIGTVMSRLSRGRRVLRLQLADHARSSGFRVNRKIGAG
jgi:RNA polymerase sigma-70 factor, ECF subfamily